MGKVRVILNLILLQVVRGKGGMMGGGGRYRERGSEGGLTTR